MKRENLFRTLLFVAMFLFMAVSVNAQSARVNSFGISDDGENLTLHTDITISGCQNVSTQVIVYFYFDNGTPLKDYNNLYKTDDGSVSAFCKVTPMYPATDFNDLQIVIPFDELHLQSGINHNLKVMIRVYANGKFIDYDTGYYPFDVTIN